MDLANTISVVEWHSNCIKQSVWKGKVLCYRFGYVIIFFKYLIKVAICWSSRLIRHWKCKWSFSETNIQQIRNRCFLQKIISSRSLVGYSLFGFCWQLSANSKQRKVSVSVKCYFQMIYSKRLFANFVGREGDLQKVICRLRIHIGLIIFIIICLSKIMF